MATQEVLWPIYQIQKLDAKIAAVARARAALDDGAALAADVAQRRRDVASLEESYRKMSLAVREQELELASVEEKLKRIETILYSGKVTNPKELQGYEGELASFRRRRGVLEEETLVHMEEKDALEERLSAAREGARESHARWQAHAVKLRDDMAALDAEDAGLIARRDDVRAVANPELLHRYDVVVRQRKLLVGLVEEDACGSCGMLLPARLVKEYKVDPDTEISCPTCSAHLLWRPPAEDPASPT